MNQETKIISLLLPSAWASALVNKDFQAFEGPDALPATEREAIDTILAEEGACMDIEDGSYIPYESAHDAVRFGVKATSCCTYQFTGGAEVAKAEANPQVEGGFRLDEWTVVYPNPSETPGGNKMHASTFRGVSTEEQGRTYAKEVRAFFLRQNVIAPVFVIKGPTSTTKKPFEVVTATAGYAVVYKIGG